MWHVDKLKCVYYIETQSVKVWWRYVSPNTNAVNFCDIFLVIGQFFRPAQTNSLENQKSGNIRTILDKIRYF